MNIQYYLLIGPDGPYNPQPINTSAVQLNNDLNTIVHKFSEHYHDAWGQRKLENGWQYGEAWSDVNKVHPRLKPYSLLNDYVSNILRWVFAMIVNTSFQSSVKVVMQIKSGRFLGTSDWHFQILF